MTESESHTSAVAGASAAELRAQAEQSARRRQIGTVAVLIAAGGGLALLATDRVWLSLTAQRAAPFSPLVVQAHGRNIYGALTGLSIVVLLGAVLMLVTGRWARIALGVLLGAISVATVVYGVRGLQTPSHSRLVELLGGSAKIGSAAVTDVSHPAWAVLTICAGLVSLAGAVLLVLLSGRWTSGLSSRYEAPASAAKSSDPWRSLDRGEDPTIFDR
ncbi:MAG: Trp biosynthesis associated, transrane protein Oprn/Chp [Frankiales bacterium]|nr:Trp biosynthesis associated, transrane protein Oprn/Chp [Frankiales bacterium]